VKAAHRPNCACVLCNPHRASLIFGHTIRNHPHECRLCKDLPWAEQNRRICDLLHRGHLSNQKLPLVSG
jgi:hypothetical protein